MEPFDHAAPAAPRPRAVPIEAIFVTEHYWPGLAEELVLPQCQRLGRVEGLLGAVALPAQQTAFGLFRATDPEAVRRAVAAVAMPASTVDPAWWLTPSGLLLT